MNTKEEIMGSEIVLLTSDGVSSLEVDAYPDGTPLINQWGLARVVRILLRPKSIQVFMAAMWFVDALMERGQVVPPELVLPFVPGARQDRLNDRGDFLFTTKSVAREINMRKFPRVVVLDPHSDVTPALIDRCEVVHAADVIKTPPGKYAAVVAPDGGAEKRAGAVARKLGVPLIHAWKTRDVATGNIDGFGMEKLLNDGLLLVVDDICDGGGTFLGLGDVIAGQRDSKAHLFVTHGLFTQGTQNLLSMYGHVYCTDSVLADAPSVIRVNVCERLLQG